MSADRDVTRIVRSWLEDGRTTLPDRVLDAVLDQLPATPQRRAFAPARRIADMNNIARIAVVAAAVVLATVGFSLLGRSQGWVAGRASPVPGPASPAQGGPQTILNTTALASGTYTVGRWFPVQFQFTVPAGWETWDTNSALVRIWKPDKTPAAGTHSAILTFEIVRGVYSDACQGTYNLRVGEGVDELVNALTHVVGLQAGAVTDIVVDGHAGKTFGLARSSGAGGQSCPSGSDLFQWTSAGPVGFGYGAQQRVIVLDVAGNRLVIDAVTYSEATRSSDAVEMDGIIGSIKIQP